MYSFLNQYDLREKLLYWNSVIWISLCKEISIIFTMAPERFREWGGEFFARKKFSLENVFLCLIERQRKKKLFYQG